MTRDQRRDSLWDYMLDEGIATKEELMLISQINGFTLETMLAVLYARTGYHSLKQIKGEDDGEN